MLGPKYSIVVPAYNASLTIAETLEAIINQTYTDFEIIVVNDGSVDQTEAIVEKYAGQDGRIRLINQSNMGTAGAYNTGVSSAQGTFVGICSADDVLYPNYLSTMDEVVLQNPQFEIYCSNGDFWTEDGAKTPVYDAPISGESGEVSLVRIIHTCFYGVGALYRRDLFDLVGGYKIDIYGEDWDFWLRAMAKGAKVFYCHKVLSAHRVSASQKSSNLVKVYNSDIRILEDFIKIYNANYEERVAVKNSIKYRKKLISQLNVTPKAARSRVDLKGLTRRILEKILGRKAVSILMNLNRAIRKNRV